MFRVLSWSGWAGIAAIAGIIAAAAALLAVPMIGSYFEHKHDVPAAPPPTPIVSPTTSDSFSLTIGEADLQTKVFTKGFWFFTFSKDSFYLLDILFRNKDSVSRTDCQMLFEYAGPEVKGNGGLFSGNWPDWYSSAGANPFFEIPGQPTFNRQAAKAAKRA